MGTRRGGGVEDFVGADLDIVAVAQLRLLANLVVVHICAVAAAEIHNGVPVILEAEQGVPPRGKLVAAERNVARWRAPDGDVTSVEHELALFAVGAARLLTRRR